MGLYNTRSNGADFTQSATVEMTVFHSSCDVKKSERRIGEGFELFSEIPSFVM